MIRFKKYIEEEIRRQPMAIPPGSNTQLQAVKFYPGTNFSGANTTRVTILLTMLGII